VYVVVRRSVQQVLQPHSVLLEMCRATQSENRGNGTIIDLDSPSTA